MLLVRKAVKTGEILINILTSSQEETGEVQNNGSEGKDIFTELATQLLNLSLLGDIVVIMHTYNDSLADDVS